MPKTSEMKESKFLKQDEVGRGVLFTVANVIQKNVAQQGADPEMKWCLTFEESDKPFVLNTTNIHLCEQVFKSDDTDDWKGKKVVLYTDPNVSYAGKITGGIRVRAPKPSAVPVAVPEPYVADIDDSDIPFAWLLPLALPLLGLLSSGVLA